MPALLDEAGLHCTTALLKIETRLQRPGLHELKFELQLMGGSSYAKASDDTMGRWAFYVALWLSSLLCRSEFLHPLK